MTELMIFEDNLLFNLGRNCNFCPMRTSSVFECIFVPTGNLDIVTEWKVLNYFVFRTFDQNILMLPKLKHFFLAYWTEMICASCELWFAYLLFLFLSTGSSSFPGLPTLLVDQMAQSGFCKNSFLHWKFIALEIIYPGLIIWHSRYTSVLGYCHDFYSGVKVLLVIQNAESCFLSSVFAGSTGNWDLRRLLPSCLLFCPSSFFSPSLPLFCVSVSISIYL